MTQDEIIELGKQAGIKGFEYYELASKEEKEAITTFVNLVVQEVRDRIMFGSRDDWVLAEREACAKVCDARAIEYDGFTEEQNASEKLAAAIRARGEA